jgi:hypothetical protein
MSTKKTIVRLLIGGSIAILVLLAVTRVRYHIIEPRTPRPPDLRGCTRLEVKYKDSPNSLFALLSGESSLLNPEEEQSLREMGTMVVSDHSVIETLAHDLLSSKYVGTFPKGGDVAVIPVIYFSAYQGDHLVSKFLIRVREIQDENRNVFMPTTKRDPVEYTPKIMPFRLREQCAEKLGHLGFLVKSHMGTAATRSISTRWCDIVGTAPPYDPYRCPSAGQGKCDYAMNPNCEPNSPADTVFLFETKSGWNQHGGPELFTFDNHDPKGGCVLLNDGTVKFIRTKEELAQLRWKP